MKMNLQSVGDALAARLPGRQRTLRGERAPYDKPRKQSMVLVKRVARSDKLRALNRLKRDLAIDLKFSVDCRSRQTSFAMTNVDCRARQASFA